MAHQRMRQLLLHVQGASADSHALAPRKLTPDDIIFGCGPIVADRNGLIPQETINAAIHAALQSGITHFDTAPLYGDSEDRLGCALAASPHGSTAKVMTKAGKLIRRLKPNRDVARYGPIPWAPFAIPNDERVHVADYSAAGARRSLVESCERMGLAANGGVHTLRIHDPDSIEGAWSQSVDAGGLIEGLMQLRTEGAIQHVSIGMNANVDHMTVTEHTGGEEQTPWDAALITGLIDRSPPGTFNSALLAYSWNLFRQDGWPVIEACRKAGIEVHVAGIMSGLHHVNAGSVRMQVTRDETKRKMDKWRALAAEHGCTIHAVALAFAALPKAVGKVVIGMKSKAEVEQNLAALQAAADVPAAIWARAQDEGLLSSELPVPR
mmetsp:Transcript_62613/g.183106  ORF Transcript_62613/g.183106 Transcript_62613/m.183106 type:complete len:380 (+) Transcript_62613:48-1187(+)